MRHETSFQPYISSTPRSRPSRVPKKIFLCSPPAATLLGQTQNSTVPRGGRRSGGEAGGQATRDQFGRLPLWGCPKAPGVAHGAAQAKRERSVCERMNCKWWTNSPPSRLLPWRRKEGRKAAGQASGRNAVLFLDSFTTFRFLYWSPSTGQNSLVN